jgi:hypothetical protein
LNAVKIFIDTSAFYALEDADDQHHKDALIIRNRFATHRPTLVTTHHVLDESVTLIGARLSPQKATRFGNALLASKIIAMVRTDESVEQAGLSLYERFEQSRISFTDCLSFAVMRALGIRKAFAFDRHFEQAGFENLRTDTPIVENH